jgi:DNA helicase-2/ATP-dependent DNA helicase PcrA
MIDKPSQFLHEAGLIKTEFVEPEPKEKKKKKKTETDESV